MSYLVERLHASEVLVAAGVKIRKVGRRQVVSVHPDYDTPALRRALRIHGMSGLQVQYSLWTDTSTSEYDEETNQCADGGGAG